MVALTHTVVLSNHRLYQFDLVRLQLNQNIRGAMDILGADARETGERLPSTFPAVELVNGAAGLPDELYFRRNLVDAVLVGCANIAAGSTGLTISLDSGAVLNPACTYPSQDQAFDAWQQYRNENGGEVYAYIYNQSTKEGEFFTYDGEQDTGAAMTISKKSGTGAWTYDYPAGFTSVYILTEWHYSLNGDLLQVVENDDNANPLNIVFGLTDFQAEIVLQNGAGTLNTFTRADDWSDIQSIGITLSGQNVYKTQVITAELESDLFPRNILSN